MSKKEMPKKITIILKMILLWLALLVGVLYLGYHATGEAFSMVWIDLLSSFEDCPQVLLYCKNKWLMISAVFVVLTVFIGITDEVQWKTIFSRRQIVLTPATRWIHTITKLGMCFSVVFIAGLSYLALSPTFKLMTTQHWEQDRLIAHACGGIDNTVYTNSYEAFELSYEQGMRTIEVDFMLTADDKLVCCHDWERALSSSYKEGHVYTEEEFLNIKIYDKYTPLSVDMLFELMKKYDDIWIVTDTKETEKEEIQKEFRFLLERAEATQSMEVLDRFVVQLYNLEMYDAVEEIYSFPSYILTLYEMGPLTAENHTFIGRYCRQRGIETITMPHEWANPDHVGMVEKYGIDIYVHTVNDMDKVEEMQSIGVKGFYTDYITPDLMVGE